MVRMNSIRRLFLLALVAAIPAAPANAETCPASTIEESPSFAAERDSLYAGTSIGDSLVAHYDLTTGTMTSARRRNARFHLGVELVDEYMIVGLPAGTPVSLTAHWAFHAVYDFGTAPSGLTSRARLLEGAANVAETQLSTTDWIDAIELPIPATAGTPFTLRSLFEYEARDGRGHADAALRFDRIPFGAAIVSCQGYRQDGVVPALPSTWGAIKSRYR